MSARAYQVRVEGVVQGVAFRHHAQMLARRLGVRGWVKNRRDGGVELWAQGEGQALESFLAWLRQGPPGARVDVFRMHEAAPAAWQGFEVLPTD